MEYEVYDSSGTDDDLPPSHQNRIARGGRIAANGRPVSASVPYPRMYGETDMETQIHQLELEAYSSVLRAFKAQSDAITWEKESFITELRKELRLSNEEHRELLCRVNDDDIIHRIREWRQASGLQSSMLNTSQSVPDPIPSPTVSASRKKQKITSSMPSQSFGGPSPSFHPQTVSASHQPSSSAAKCGPVHGPKGKKQKPTIHGTASLKSVLYPSPNPSGRGHISSRISSGAAPDGVTPDSLINKRVKTRWPDDNNFYEAVITKYDQDKGLYALVYDMETENETWEWVNLSEISPEDIQWVDEDPGISHRGGYGGSAQGMNRSLGRDGVLGLGRGRGTKAQSRKDLLQTQNGIGKKVPDIQILHTGTLIQEVERIFGLNHPDPLEIEKAKRKLQDHERSLIGAISRLADVSDGESDYGLAMERE